jgi:hypothetical protein
MLADGQAPMFPIEVPTTLQKKFFEFYEAGKGACAVDFTHVAPKDAPRTHKGKCHAHPKSAADSDTGIDPSL